MMINIIAKLIIINSNLKLKAHSINHIFQQCLIMNISMLNRVTIINIAKIIVYWCKYYRRIKEKLYNIMSISSTHNLHNYINNIINHNITSKLNKLIITNPKRDMIKNSINCTTKSNINSITYHKSTKNHINFNTLKLNEASHWKINIIVIMM